MLRRTQSLPETKTLQQQQVPLFTIPLPQSWFPNLMQPPIDETSKYFSLLCIQPQTNGTDQRDATDLQHDESTTAYDPLPSLTRPRQALQVDDLLEHAAQQRFRELCTSGNTLQAILQYVEDMDQRAKDMGSVEPDISGNMRTLLNIYGTGQPLLIDAASMAFLWVAPDDDPQELNLSFRELWVEKNPMSALIGLVRGQRHRKCFTSTEARVFHLASCVVEAQLVRIQSKWPHRCLYGKTR